MKKSFLVVEIQQKSSFFILVSIFDLNDCKKFVRNIFYNERKRL